ncbi:S-adenosylmethionine decarboxylase [Candidatus Daviesbacteria bacterium RIFOXYD1_FULL_41_10]|uniref:S-adenosylmethionine decarboxylase n=2 Tax=Candidatus Daviesiibacteriota TaxID=1752718 RepID=A0A1F5N033_9BACT|nr:MAG: S-adenosylmethionine decarboxylase related protein [Candidatus Daviesbacteria bacterium GW2011_GWB1_41_5]OGE70961.1 MAG: S-adenosylmethionine decarboxylase [Candidatus Daviesbacteria bacterium RIFOXYD1_FULL_41_10]
MADRIKLEYDKNNTWGMVASIDLHVCNPQYIRSKSKIKEFVLALCDLIEVKRFGECIIINFGERDEIQGYSMTQLIETSLISGHFANKTNNTYLDIFSCKYFNPEQIAKFSQHFFQSKDYKLHYIFRK